MAKLIVEVLHAGDLLPTDDQGSPSPFVQVDFDGRRQRTQTKTRDLYPSWNEKLVFDIQNPRNLHTPIIEVTLYDDRCANRYNNFLGCVKISGASVPLSDSEAVIQKYSLCKLGSFSHGRGDISLRIYAVRARYYRNQPQHSYLKSKKNLKLQEINYDDVKRKEEEIEHVGTSGGAESRSNSTKAMHLGTQADDAFPEALHSDSHHNTRSNVYISPTLYYLRIHVFKAQDLEPLVKNQLPEFYVRARLGIQLRTTRLSKMPNHNPVWNEELTFVASEPFDEFIKIDVHNSMVPAKEGLIGVIVLSLCGIPQRFDSIELPQARWFLLNEPSSFQEGGKKKKKKQGKILLMLCLEGGYDVFNSTLSDLQPSAKHLRKDSIGSVELTILSARNLPMKQGDGGTTDAYCVVKYGNKWVRTRTILNSQEPCWNEHYAWEVYDYCTIIMIGIFHNRQVIGSLEDIEDFRIGKVRIPLQTLEVNRMHKYYYPLLLLNPSGLKNHGELQVAVRFTGITWANMVAQYTKPRLPKMHYLQPITVSARDWLRHQAAQKLCDRFSRAKPPLRKEIVKYMLDEEARMWSLRKQKANWDRLMSFVLGITALCRWFDEIRHWRNPLKTVFVHVMYLVLVWYPKLILPTFFLYLSMTGLWNYKFRPRSPPHMDARLSHAHVTNLDHLDEEFDTFPTTRRSDIVKMRYDRLRSIACRYQTMVGDIATLGERAMAILTCEDLIATSIFTIIALFWVVVIYMASFRVVATLLGLYRLRHPWFRNKMPCLLVNLFNRLPSKNIKLF